MPTTLHIEKHFTATEVVCDIVIGMSDGLTVPFALAAGVSAATNATNIVVTAGLAEIAAGSIAMGLGGYLAARTDAEHFASECVREMNETQTMPDAEADEVAAVFRGYGLSEGQIAPVVAAIRSDQTRWLDFMMRFELGLDEPDPKRAVQSALTIALSYIAGGLIPLAPYILLNTVSAALPLSVVMTLIVLAVFGFVKARFTRLNPLRGAFQTVAVGGLTAAVAFMLARLIG